MVTNKVGTDTLELALFPVKAKGGVLPVDDTMRCQCEILSGKGDDDSRSKNNFIPNASLLHPFTNNHLRLFILVVVGSVDEVTPSLVESVEVLARLLEVKGAAHERGPLVAEGHGT